MSLSRSVSSPGRIAVSGVFSSPVFPHFVREKKNLSTQDCSVVLIPKDPRFGNQLNLVWKLEGSHAEGAKNVCVCTKREERGREGGSKHK